jgi:hypothetical protein
MYPPVVYSHGTLVVGTACHPRSERLVVGYVLLEGFVVSFPTNLVFLEGMVAVLLWEGRVAVLPTSLPVPILDASPMLLDAVPVGFPL